MSFFCTVLVGILPAYDPLFMVGSVKVGMDIPLEVGAEVPAAGLRTPNGVVLLLLPNGVVLEAASDNPVAITVILA